MTKVWRPFTRSYNLTDYGGEPPQWMIEQRAEQKRQIDDLRSYRSRQALALLKKFAAGFAWPSGFDAAYSGWRDACMSLPDWKYGYKSRWFIAQLEALGYTVTGSRRTRYKFGTENLFRVRIPIERIDDRVITAPQHSDKPA